MSYKLVYDNKTLNDVKKIPKDILISIRKAIESRLSERPYDFKALSGKKYVGIYRLRISDYRIAYAINESQMIVKILAIGHRSNVYKLLGKRLNLA